MADAIVRRFFSIFQGSVYKCVSCYYSTKAEDRGAPLAPALRVAVIRAGLVVAPILLPGPSGHIVKN